MPAPLKRPLARAILAIEDVKKGRAYRDNVLDDIHMRRALWHMANVARDADDLQAARARLVSNDHVASPEDRAAAERAQSELDTIVSHLEQIAEDLTKSAAEARELSTHLENAEARDRALAERDHIAAQQISHRAHLDARTAAADVTGHEAFARDAADAAVSQTAAYLEMVRLGGASPHPTDGEEAINTHRRLPSLGAHTVAPEDAAGGPSSSNM